MSLFLSLRSLLFNGLLDLGGLLFDLVLNFLGLLLVRSRVNRELVILAQLPNNDTDDCCNNSEDQGSGCDAAVLGALLFLTGYLVEGLLGTHLEILASLLGLLFSLLSLAASLATGLLALALSVLLGLLRSLLSLLLVFLGLLLDLAGQFFSLLSKLLARVGNLFLNIFCPIGCCFLCSLVLCSCHLLSLLHRVVELCSLLVPVIRVAVVSGLQSLDSQRDCVGVHDSPLLVRRQQASPLILNQ